MYPVQNRSSDSFISAITVSQNTIPNKCISPRADGPKHTLAASLLPPVSQLEHLDGTHSHTQTHRQIPDQCFTPTAMNEACVIIWNLSTIWYRLIQMMLFNLNFPRWLTVYTDRFSFLAIETSITLWHHQHVQQSVSKYRIVCELNHKITKRKTTTVISKKKLCTHHFETW